MFFEGYCVWSKEEFQLSSIIKWRTNILISEEHLQLYIVACAMYLTDVSISGVLLFQIGTYSDRFWVGHQYFRRLLPVFIQDTVFLWNKHLQSSLLWKELINLTHELNASISWNTLSKFPESYPILHRGLKLYSKILAGK